MLQGIDVTQRIEFISEKDPSKDNPTVFVFRPLSGIESIKLSKGNSQDDDIVNLLKATIVEVRNFAGNKEAVAFEEVVGKLPAIILGELIGKMNKINQVTEEERKN